MPKDLDIQLYRDSRRKQ